MRRGDQGDILKLELFIARFLRYGVLLAGGLMMVGWLSQISFSNDVFAQFHEYHGTRLIPTLMELYHRGDLWHLLSYAGLLVLISLPILRVLMTFVVFLRMKDFLLAGISAVVLLGILLSVTLGFEI